MRVLLLLLSVGMFAGCFDASSKSLESKISKAEQKYDEILASRLQHQLQEAKQSNALLSDILTELRSKNLDAPKGAELNEDDAVMITSLLRELRQRASPDQVTKQFHDFVDTTQKTVAIDGSMVNVDSFIAQWYKRPWTHPGGIDKHLQEHGVSASDLGSLSHQQKLNLHAAIHERGLETSQSAIVAKNTKAPRSTRSVYASSSQTCRGPSCPTAAVPKAGWFYYIRGR